jgi:hypothetical protein
MRCPCVLSSTVYTRVSNEPRMFRLIHNPSHGFIRVHAVSLENRLMLIYAGSLPVSVPLLAQKRESGGLQFSVPLWFVQGRGTVKEVPLVAECYSIR